MEKYLSEEGPRSTRTNQNSTEERTCSPEPLIHLSIAYLTYYKSRIYLCEIQEMTPTDLAFEPKLDKLMAILHRHIDDHERKEDMSRSEVLLPRAESEKHARSFQRTKKIVLTRSHPAVRSQYFAESPCGVEDDSHQSTPRLVERLSHRSG